MLDWTVPDIVVEVVAADVVVLDWTVRDVVVEVVAADVVVLAGSVISVVVDALTDIGKSIPGVHTITNQNQIRIHKITHISNQRYFAL